VKFYALWLALVTFLAPAVLAGSVSYQADADPQSSQEVEPDPVSAIVTPEDREAAYQWLDEFGSEALQGHAAQSFPDLTEEQLAQLTLGRAYPTLNIATANNGVRFVPSTEWVALIDLQGEPQGVFTFDQTIDGGILAQSMVLTDPILLRHVAEIGDRVLVWDDALGGWFAVSSDETITAADQAGQEYLVGETTVREFVSIRSELVGPDDATATTLAVDEGGGSNMVPIVALTVGGIFAITLIVTWLRHVPEERKVAASPDEAVTTGTLKQVQVYRREGHTTGETAAIQASAPSRAAPPPPPPAAESENS